MIYLDNRIFGIPVRSEKYREGIYFGMKNIKIMVCLLRIILTFYLSVCNGYRAMLIDAIRSKDIFTHYVNDP